MYLKTQISFDLLVGCQDIDSRVTGDPSNIGHASKLVFRVNVEDVLDGEKSSEKVSTCRVNDTLGLSGRSRCLRGV
jgi:hypothetical protein